MTDRKLTAFWQRYNMMPRGGTVITAVSGGKDSMCMLDLLIKHARQYGCSVVCAHFNHMIRADAAVNDAEFVRDYCDKNGIPFILGSGDCPKYARENRMGIEEAARVLRYKFLEDAAEKYENCRVATAHSSDDNAETVIMNLIRGAGGRGLCGIPPVRGIFIRPILEMSADEVIKYNEENGIPWVFDATNDDNTYTRNNVRNSIIPQLKAINPRFSEHASNAAALLRLDEEYFDELISAFLKENYIDGKIAVSALRSLHFSVFSRVIRHFSPAANFEHIEAVRGLLDGAPSAKVDLPDMRISREYEYLSFSDGEDDTFKPVFICAGDNIAVGRYRVSCEKEIYDGRNYHKKTVFLFKSSDICDKILVRPRKTGDEIKLYEKQGTKSLKKLFIEAKIPRRMRGGVPVVCCGGSPIAVCGFGADIKYKIAKGDEVFKLQFKEICDNDN